jgi:3-phosphoshikimate 1-carboxyvinyltransferase
MDYRIFPPEEINDADISLPLSKSISNRVLIINALTGNAGEISQVAKCDDTDVMLAALASADDTIDVGAAGTAMRFLTAYFALQQGRTVTLTGSERMKQRPIKVLVDALRACGADIQYVGNEGYPPLKITGKKLAGGEITLDASVSSQYISALLMTAPYMADGLTLTLSDTPVSLPYIKMTIGIMKQWGVACEFDENVIKIAPQPYKPIHFKVEADWSAASYWFELAAFSFADIRLNGLSPDSLQGDSAVNEIFKNFGIEAEWTDSSQLELTPSPDITPRLIIDLADQPDLAQTVVVTCCVLNIPFHITGLSTLKIKETDRLDALCTELRKLSFLVSQPDDASLVWEGERVKPSDDGIAIDTYKDHRMALAFAPVSYFVPGIVINDVEVVSKSYPDYWDHLRQIGFNLVPQTPAE